VRKKNGEIPQGGIAKQGKRKKKKIKTKSPKKENSN